MAAIDEARCWQCNRPWPLRAQPCPVFEGDDPTKHTFVVPVSAIEAALDGLPESQQATSAMIAGERIMLARVRRALLGAPDE